MLLFYIFELKKSIIILFKISRLFLENNKALIISVIFLLNNYPLISLHTCMHPESGHYWYGLLTSCQLLAIDSGCGNFSIVTHSPSLKTFSFKFL